MSDGCSRDEYLRLKRSSIALFDQIISDLAVGQVDGRDVHCLVDNILNMCSSGQNGSPTMPQDERGGMAEWSEPPANGQLQ